MLIQHFHEKCGRTIFILANIPDWRSNTESLRTHHHFFRYGCSIWWYRSGLDESQRLRADEHPCIHVGLHTHRQDCRQKEIHEKSSCVINKIHWNPQFIDFASHYGFMPKLCLPGRKETKGKIERPFSYTDYSFKWDDSEISIRAVFSFYIGAFIEKLTH